ncbi:kynureninase [Mucilaginibacter ginsenosidivorans]|uniref:Kynureninase n=1 Tax=Mucilaginibacter ginsenosidivorans TaxID=398053 RepID=A0A5B8UYI3_9SPHI|nr:kynureninase [Mucilaginibacter ginsenosidivorans]QEC64267.1 kynureninase [Mucilaginibacter ginsenosidivorans]
MIHQNTLEFAEALDAQDELKAFRKEFLIPQHEGNDVIYLCGNSLGLQPKSVSQYVGKQLGNWQQHGVEGWFNGDDPWLLYHEQMKKPLAAIVGAKPEEVTIMNSLTVNLHLLLVSFYQPNSKRYKILVEGGAFPSDQYAIESQVNFHGFDAKNAVIEVFPREGEYTLNTGDILSAIEKNADELALVLFSGINYYTGQVFDMKAIAETAHKAGAYCGFDLAHAAGNVPLALHDWGVDFACWCSYKYMNSGPGGISGIFVHEKHFENKELKRFAGWWGYGAGKRFLMTQGFVPASGAEGWQVSTSPILLMAVHKAAIDLFEKVGGLEKLRKKSLMLTGYLEYMFEQINQKYGEELFKIITPKDAEWRGCQLSIICKRDGKKTFDYLTQNGVIGDWREPDVIRLSPVPFYNTFKDVYNASKLLDESLTALV